MSRLEHLPHAANPDRIRVREAHDRSWAAWQVAVQRVDAVKDAVIRPVRVRNSDPERSSPLPGGLREKVQRELFDE